MLNNTTCPTNLHLSSITDHQPTRNALNSQWPPPGITTTSFVCTQTCLVIGCRQHTGQEVESGRRDGRKTEERKEKRQEKRKVNKSFIIVTLLITFQTGKPHRNGLSRMQRQPRLACPLTSKGKY
jgi:hypothetical protein